MKYKLDFTNGRCWMGTYEDGQTAHAALNALVCTGFDAKGTPQYRRFLTLDHDLTVAVNSIVSCTRIRDDEEEEEEDAVDR